MLILFCFRKELIRGQSHIDFRTQCVIMTLTGGGAITNDVLKFRKDIEFDSSCIVIHILFLYLPNRRWGKIIYQLRK